MTLPDTSVTVEDAPTGVEHALVTKSGKVYPVAMIADDSGHIQQTVPGYLIGIKAQAGAAAKDHFDVFNGVGSGKLMELRGLWITPAIHVIVTGTVAPDFDIYRTNTVGTGGTALTYGAAAFPTIAPADPADGAPPAQVTARAAPTAGAAIEDAIICSYIPQEESWAGTNIVQFMNEIPETVMARRFSFAEGTGFKVRQITAGAAQNFTLFAFITLT